MHLAGSAARIVAGVVAAAITVVVGLAAAGPSTRRRMTWGSPRARTRSRSSARSALIVGIVAYAAVEWAQTRRLDSIARQFSTRAVVLMALAIPINIVLGQVVGARCACRCTWTRSGRSSSACSPARSPARRPGCSRTSPGRSCSAARRSGRRSRGRSGSWPRRSGSSPAWSPGPAGSEAGRTRRCRRLVAGVLAGAALLWTVVAFGILPFYRGMCATLGAQPGALGTCFELLAAGGERRPGPSLGRTRACSSDSRSASPRWPCGSRAAATSGWSCALVAGSICGVLSALIAAPIAALVFGGVTGGGTDLLVAMFLQAGVGPPERGPPAGADLRFDRQVDQLRARVHGRRRALASPRRAVPAGRSGPCKVRDRGDVLTVVPSAPESGGALAPEDAALLARLAPPAPTAFHRLNPLTKATFAAALTVAAIGHGGYVVPALLLASAFLAGRRRACWTGRFAWRCS